MSLFARNPRRLLALVMIPACLALSACGGEEETPSTQVVVPEETAAPVAALELTKPPAGEVAEVAGYVTMADERQVRMIIEDGTEQVFLVAPNMASIGIAIAPTHGSDAATLGDLRGRGRHADPVGRAVLALPAG